MTIYLILTPNTVSIGGSKVQAKLSGQLMDTGQSSSTYTTICQNPFARITSTIFPNRFEPLMLVRDNITDTRVIIYIIYYIICGCFVDSHHNDDVSLTN